MPVPSALLNLNFADIKAEVESALSAANTAVEFIDKWGWFIPAKYKDSLNELIKLLTWAETFLNKLP